MRLTGRHVRLCVIIIAITWEATWHYYTVHPSTSSDPVQKVCFLTWLKEQPIYFQCWWKLNLYGFIISGIRQNCVLPSLIIFLYIRRFLFTVLCWISNKSQWGNTCFCVRNAIENSLIISCEIHWSILFTELICFSVLFS